MFILGNLLTTIARITGMAVTVYSFVIIIAAILSWVNPDPYHPLVRILRNLTEPVYARIRRWLPFVFMGGMDLSPIVLLLALQLFNGVVVQSLLQIGLGM